MVKKLTFLNECRSLPAGFSIDFRPGVNLLVGDQGCGKSTVLNALEPNSPLPDQFKRTVVRDDNTRIKAFDFERLNPRTASGFGCGASFEVESSVLFMSHGQANVRLLADVCKQREPHTFLLDEPDTGLSIRSAVVVAKFFATLAARGHQIIAPIHNAILIQLFDEVCSLEHRQWMKSGDFVKSQLG